MHTPLSPKATIEARHAAREAPEILLAEPGLVPGGRNPSSMLARLALTLAVVVVAAVCGSPAQQIGVGIECASNDDCNSNDDFEQTCLSFKGGYCGLEDCESDEDCPGGSACVTHDDGENYCFLLCRDKPECNGDRSAENESNCSANITFTDPQDEGVKACVPPTSD